MRDFIDRRNLTLVNSMELCKGKWTRLDKRSDNKTIIDLVIANEDMQPKLKSMKIDEERLITPARYIKRNGKSVEVQSDHNCITIEITGNSGISRNRITRWNLRNEKSLNQFSKITENIIMKENWLTTGDVNSKYKRWHNQVKSVMYQCFKRVTEKNNNSSNLTTKLIKEQKIIKKKIRTLVEHGLQDGVGYQLLNTQLSNKITEIDDNIKEEKSKKLQKRLDSMMQKGQERSNEIWKIRKQALRPEEQKMAIKDKKGNLLTCKDNIFNRFTEYYQELLKPRPPNPENEDTTKEMADQFNLYMKSRSHENDTINRPFTMTEINQQIRNLKNNKSPGPDEIPNELLKSAGTNLTTSILNLMNWMWTHEVIPDALKVLDVKTIYKGKGSISELSNHRGIFISNTILKLYEKLMDSRSTPRIERDGFTESQAGGRRKRNITDHLFIIRSVMQHFKYLNKKLIIELIDLVKAFDTMILANVMVDLWQSNVRGKIWRNIYTINRNALIKIKTSFGKSPEIEIGETLKQGSVLASTLAALHTDKSNNYFTNTGLGIYYGNIPIGSLIFQDDLARLEEDEQKLNLANIQLNCFKERNRMKFHPTKSAFITTKPIGKSTIKLGGTILEENSTYKYLGDILTSDGKLKETIAQRRNGIAGVTAELNAITDSLRQSSLFIPAILQYHSAIILPRLLLNSEAWNQLSSLDLAELETIQLISLKRLLRFPKSTPSAGLRNELGILSIKNKILLKKGMYLHRLLALPSTNITQQVLLQQQSLPGNTWLLDTMHQLTSTGLDCSLENIQNMKKTQWKKILTDVIEKADRKENQSTNGNSSKCKLLEPTTSQPAPYISKLEPSEAYIVLKTRLGMINLKSNFKTCHQNQNCPLCLLEIDSLPHLFQCPKLKSQSKVSHTDLPKIFSNKEIDLPFLAKMAQAIKQKLSERSVLMEKEEQSSTTASGALIRRKDNA